MDFFFVVDDRNEARADMRAALKQVHMRRILRRLLSASNFTGQSKGATDEQTAFNEGVRAVGVTLARLIEDAETGALAKLMLESCEDFAVAANTPKKENRAYGR
ncbi:MAG: hypothetical protein LBO64_03375 [Desulfovibrio sp.]|jgi:hypothetical protein|nr:hypothetical protein [Desulfovibrio sp.]